MNTMDLLAIEDVNLICAVSGAACQTRGQVIDGICGMMPHVQDAEMDILANRTICLLKEMSDDEFDGCHFSEMIEALL